MLFLAIVMAIFEANSVRFIMKSFKLEWENFVPVGFSRTPLVAGSIDRHRVDYESIYGPKWFIGTY